MSYKIELQSNNVDLQTILDTIRVLPNEGTGGIDTSDATAVANDIASGKTAYVNGQKVTGNIVSPTNYVGTVQGEGTYASIAEGTHNNEKAYAVSQVNLEKIIVDAGGLVVLGLRPSEFGNATASDVAAGKTFTSENGLKVTGTIPTTVVSLGSSDRGLEIGSLDLGDGNGSKNYAFIQRNLPEKTILNSNSVLTNCIDPSTLGDATDVDVIAGKTFTSKNGVKITGTASLGGGLPEGLTAIATGTFTLTSDSSTSIYVAHGLGKTPDFCWWTIETDVSTTRLSSATITGYLANKPASYSSSLTSPYYTHLAAVSYNSSGTIQRTAQSLEAASHTDTTCCIWANAQYKLKAGHTYRWVCGVVDI